MTDRYENIRKALAMGPTRGLWRVSGTQSVRGAQGEYIAKANWSNGAANAAHIAACDPDTIRELLEERDALREALDELLEALQSIVDEVSDGRIPYSSDSYLPAHLVEQARAAIDASMQRTTARGGASDDRPARTV